MRHCIGLGLLAVVVGGAAPARAQPARTPQDPRANPCYIGNRERALGHLARAHLGLSLCARGHGPRADAARAALPGLVKALRAAGDAAVTIETDPPGALATVDSLGAIEFPTPFTVWLAPGVVHQVRAIKLGYYGAAQQVRFDDAEPFSLSLALDPVEKKPANASVDFSKEGDAGSVTSSADLPGAKHDELLPKRFRGGVYEPDAELPRPWHAGLAVGAGRADLIGGGAANARVGLSVAALVDYRIRGAFHLVPEVGVAQRGADGAGLTQLTVPVAAAWRATPWLELGAGPELAVEIAGDLPDAAPFELGANAVARLLLGAGPGELFVDLGAHLGLTAASGDARTTAATARVGYLY